MVSWRSLLAFLAFYLFYLLMGSYMIYATECPDEIAVKSRKAAETREARELAILKSHLLNRSDELWMKVSPAKMTSILKQELPELKSKIQASARQGVAEDIDCVTWSFFNSFFMAFTSITTIGFGTVAPQTQLGRGTCLIYSIIGMPINSILIGFIGNSFIKQVSEQFHQYIYCIPQTTNI